MDTVNATRSVLVAEVMGVLANLFTRRGSRKPRLAMSCFKPSQTARPEALLQGVSLSCPGTVTRFQANLQPTSRLITRHRDAIGSY
ncbi:hypothetical protein J2S68_001822 [Glycomyces algeriensis]|nr:hypothetical protein [Glycomyces algeriensis]